MDAHPPFPRPSRALRDGVRNQTQEILPSIDYLLLHQGKERCLNFLSQLYYHMLVIIILPFEDVHSAYRLSSPSKPGKTTSFMFHVLHPPSWN